MKKTLWLVVLGIALLGRAGSASAEPPIAGEPRWSIRAAQETVPSPLDLGRWFARLFLDAIDDPVPEPPIPGTETAPDDGRPPADANVVCTPDRVHCPFP